MPYNKSIFKIRDEYYNVFPDIAAEDQKKALQEEKRNHHGTVKMFKIKYQCNLLCGVSTENGQLMNALADTDELIIFESDLIRDLI
jgi:hypothetical protein